MNSGFFININYLQIKIRLQNRHGFDDDLLASSESSSSSDVDNESIIDSDSNNDDNNLVVVDTLNISDSDSDNNNPEVPIVAIRTIRKVKKTKSKFRKNKTKSLSRKSTNKLKSKSQKSQKLSSQIKLIKQTNAHYNGGGENDTIANIDHYDENLIDDNDSITIFVNDNPNNLDAPDKTPLHDESTSTKLKHKKSNKKITQKQKKNTKQS